MFIIDYLNGTDNVLVAFMIWLAATAAIALVVNLLRPVNDRNYATAVFVVIVCEMALAMLIVSVSMVVDGFSLGFAELLKRFLAACVLSGFAVFQVWWLVLPHRKRRR